MFSIFDCITRERVSAANYATAEEANHDYSMNSGSTYVDCIADEGAETVAESHTTYAVVAANGQFKRRNRQDSGEYETQRQAEAYLATLPNPEDYTVQSFTEDRN